MEERHGEIETIKADYDEQLQRIQVRKFRKLSQ